MRNITTEYYRTKKEVLSQLGICETTLQKYKKLLSQTVPDEWKHTKGDHRYSPESFEALKRVRSLYREQFNTGQIKKILISEGI